MKASYAGLKYIYHLRPRDIIDVSCYLPSGPNVDLELHHDMTMEITNCRRILAIGPPECGLLELLKDLTGTTPTPNPDNTLAGLSHTWKITTPYYSATIPIWLDEITSAPTWSSEFLKPEAREVLSVLGAFVVCFRKPVDRAQLERIKGLLEAVREVVREGCGFAWGGVCLAVGMRQSVTPYLEMSGKEWEEWEDFCGDLGFEWVDFEAVGRNEFGGMFCSGSPVGEEVVVVGL